MKQVDVSLNRPIRPKGTIEKIHRIGPRSAHVTILGDPMIEDDVILCPEHDLEPGKQLTFTTRAFKVTDARNAKGVTAAFLEEAGTCPWHKRAWWLLVGKPRVALPEEGSTAIVVINERFDHRGVEVILHG